MKLAHLPLSGLTSYTHAAHLQDHLVRTILASKPKYQANSNSNTSISRTAARPLPNPTILTAQFNPVYTCGRREIATLTEDEKTYLRAGGAAEFHEALRGGQTTFHGPGQLVAYPVIDLRRHVSGGLSPRDYVHLLEESVIQTCAQYGVRGFRTENPGVWTAADRKICAVGVHMRRNVTSHGVGLNVVTDLGWFARIVACGLEGMGASSLETEGVSVEGGLEEVGKVFVRMFAEGLGISQEDIMEIGEGDVRITD